MGSGAVGRSGEEDIYGSWLLPCARPLRASRLGPGEPPPANPGGAPGPLACLSLPLEATWVTDLEMSSCGAGGEAGSLEHRKEGVDREGTTESYWGRRGGQGSGVQE